MTQQFSSSVYIYSREIKTYIHTKILYTPIFIATLVIIENGGHNPNVYQLMSEWMNEYGVYIQRDVCVHAESLQSYLTLQPCGMQPARLIYPWDSLVRNTRVDCHALLQGIFPAQGSNLHLMSTCIGRWVLYHLRLLGSLWKWKSLSCVRLFATLWAVACQVPLSMGFSRQGYWSDWPFPSPGHLPDPGIEPGLPYCRQTLYHLSHQGIHASKEMLKILQARPQQCVKGQLPDIQIGLR